MNTSGKKVSLHSSNLSLLIKKCTSPELSNIDPQVLIEIKKECKTSPANVQLTFDVLWAYLLKKETSVDIVKRKVHSLTIMNELFTRSGTFRDLMGKNIDRFIEITLGTKDELQYVCLRTKHQQKLLQLNQNRFQRQQSSEGIQSRDSEIQGEGEITWGITGDDLEGWKDLLRERSLSSLEAWSSSTHVVPQIQIAFRYLTNTLKIELPEIEKERKRIEQAKEKRLLEEYQVFQTDFQSYSIEIKTLQREMEETLKLLVSTFNEDGTLMDLTLRNNSLSSNITATNIINNTTDITTTTTTTTTSEFSNSLEIDRKRKREDEESNFTWSELASKYGLGSSEYSLTIEFDPSSELKRKESASEVIEPLALKLKENRKLIEKVYLPKLKNWTDLLIKVEPQDQLQKSDFFRKTAQLKIDLMKLVQESEKFSPLLSPTKQEHNNNNNNDNDNDNEIKEQESVERNEDEQEGEEGEEGEDEDESFESVNHNDKEGFEEEVPEFKPIPKPKSKAKSNNGKPKKTKKPQTIEEELKLKKTWKMTRPYYKDDYYQGRYTGEPRS